MEAVQNATIRNAGTNKYFFTPAKVEIVIDIWDYFLDIIPVRFLRLSYKKKLRASPPEVYSYFLISNS
jgi:hypothetical protein